MTAHPLSELAASYRLTVADWLAMDEEPRIVEIIEGDVYMAPSPSIRHPRIAREIAVRLHAYLAKSHPTAELFFAPTGVKLSDDTVLEPDLLIVLDSSGGRVKEKYVDGAPDVVIEVLSPGTASRDLGIKRDQYLAGGVPEYWVVDGELRTIEAVVLKDGAYVRHALATENDVLTSPTLPDLAMDLTEIWPG